MWHVAAHEIGHAIYGLDGVKDAIKVSTKTMLEEPRAELTALHTMTLLLPAGLLKTVSILFVSCTDQQSPTHWDFRHLSHTSVARSETKKFLKKLHHALLSGQEASQAADILKGCPHT